MTPRTPTAATTAQSRDLSIDEARGGHTLARHVGKSDAELLARLKAEPDISAASTYTDRATAERVVAQVITKKRAEIEKWEARDGSRPNLALRLALGVVIGRSTEQGETRAVEVRDAVVVLRWTGTVLPSSTPSRSSIPGVTAGSRKGPCRAASKVFFTRGCL